MDPMVELEVVPVRLSAAAVRACAETARWLRRHPDAYGDESLAYTVRCHTADASTAVVREVRAALGAESLTRWGWGKTAREVARELEALAGVDA